MSEKIIFTDNGPQGEYERVLTASVRNCAVTLCFQDRSHGKNLEAIVAAFKNAYRQRVKNWS